MDESRTNMDQLSMLANALGFYSNFSEAKMEKDGDFWMIGEESGVPESEEKKAEYGDQILKDYKQPIPAENRYRTRAQRTLKSQFIIKREQKRVEKEKEAAEKRRLELASEREVFFIV